MTIAFLVIKLLSWGVNDDFKLLCDSMLINFLSYYFKVEIICIGTVASMNDLLSALKTSLCIRYLTDNQTKSFWVMSFRVLSAQIFVCFSRFIMVFFI